MIEEVRKPALLRTLFTLGSEYSAQELFSTKMLGQIQDAGNVVTLVQAERAGDILHHIAAHAKNRKIAKKGRGAIFRLSPGISPIIH